VGRQVVALQERPRVGELLVPPPGLVLHPGTVTLLISHRFSTVRMADLILVLDDGRIRERGTHGELMRLGGVCAELYELQARAYR
jgi:ABC-type multidrug transport system fused ATPase/permease subunit